MVTPIGLINQIFISILKILPIFLFLETMKHDIFFDPLLSRHFLPTLFGLASLAKDHETFLLRKAISQPCLQGAT